MSIISEMMSYPFIVRALIGGVLVSLCASLLGVSLVLKRYSMIGDGLSHVSFGALSVALAAGWSPLKISIPVVVLAAFFLLRITAVSYTHLDVYKRQAQKTPAVVETLISYFLHLFPAVKTKNPEHGLGDGAPVFAVH